MPLASGSRIEPYEVIAPLGAGGMGEVYRARDPRIGRDVAIKVLPASFASDPDRLARFEQEARAAGGLNHPNLLVIFDFGTHEGSPYLVTELLEGETLRERLGRDAVSPRKAIDWATQLAEALAAAHDKGVIHRDIKPENIFLTRDERVKLLDFGVSKLIDGNTAPAADEETELRRTDPGSVLGTPGYMAPEQVRAEALDERTDVFALGIVVAEMVSGSHPFQQATRVETMTAILNKDVALTESLPPGLARIIDRMLAKRPGSRFQSMKDVAFALQLLSGIGVSGESSRSGISAAIEPAAVPDFLGITFRRGRIGGARITPDGSIVYGAAWEGKSVEVFVSSPGTPDARAIGLADADVLAASAGGELAVSLGRRFLGGWVATGTLARNPLAGGAPRKIAEKILAADWAPAARASRSSGTRTTAASSSNTRSGDACVRREDGSATSVFRETAPGWPSSSIRGSATMRAARSSSISRGARSWIPVPTTRASAGSPGRPMAMKSGSPDSGRHWDETSWDSTCPARAAS